MFMNQQLLDQLRARFRETGVDPTYLGKKCEYYFLMRDINGQQQGIGGVEGIVVAVHPPGVAGRMVIDVAVDTNMPELYVVSERLSVMHYGDSVAYPGCPLFYEWNSRSTIKMVMEGAIKREKERLATATNQVRHLKLVPKKDN